MFSIVECNPDDIRELDTIFNVGKKGFRGLTHDELFLVNRLGILEDS
jgi:hypothetical protein